MACRHHKQCQTEASQAAEKLCEKHGYRFTESRRQVFDALMSSHKALTAMELMQMTGNKQPPMTYRALEFLTEAGLVHYVSSINAYIGCYHPYDERHTPEFLICKECHDVEEVDPSEAVPLLMKPTRTAKFKPVKTHIEILGVCAACQN